MTTKAMKLHYLQIQSPRANAEKLVILHGLLGSANNWQSFAKDMGDAFSSYALDLRNHGASPHTKSMHFKVMAEDLLEFLNAHSLNNIHLIGHSLGGKVAMHFASQYPDYLKSLTVVDIAPRAYKECYRTVFEILKGLPVFEMKRRTEAEHAISSFFKESSFRKFLLTNLIRDDQGQFHWRVNFDHLLHAYPNLCENPLQTEVSFQKNALFVVGGQSDYVSYQDHKAIKQHFSKARIEIIESSGHNPHIETPEAFCKLFRNFTHSLNDTRKRKPLSD